MLHEFVVIHRDEIVRRCRARVGARTIPPPTAAEIDHGVPLFLDQLAAALRSGLGSSPAIGFSAGQHGHDLRRQGFTVSQVVHDYGDICQTITELAMETDAPIDTDEFRILNACLDDAIAIAVTQFAREGDQSAVDGELVRGNERLGFFAHELRNLINTSILALDVLKSGNVGVGGSTGAVLARSLKGARDLISRSLAEVRTAHGVQNPEQFLLAGFIADLEHAARLAAEARGITLAVMPVDGTLAIEADRPVLSAVVMNLLQNAVKFTRPGTTVTLRTITAGPRVRIEIQDQCGGLPDDNVEVLFRPFEQRGINRSGLGLGLAFSRWGVEANHGTIEARNIPGEGCVFAVELPRLTLPALAAC